MAFFLLSITVIYLFSQRHALCLWQSGRFWRQFWYHRSCRLLSVGVWTSAGVHCRSVHIQGAVSTELNRTFRQGERFEARSSTLPHWRNSRNGFVRYPAPGWPLWFPNWLAPFSSTPFGDMYSSTALNERSCNAPIVIYRHASCTRPTSVSSRLPRKMRSFMLATVAIVVPSLNVLLMITELPTLIGTSRISPVMVERINVLLNEALFLVIPSFTISRLSLAVCNSSRACFTSTLFVFFVADEFVS